MKPQYVGCAGKVTNAVNVVNATYSTDRGHALVGSRVYVPVEQVDDPVVRRAMLLFSRYPFSQRSQSPGRCADRSV
ncbi:hypothetical protein ABGB07_35450 [Micromonosporaceae bacterium B7E4]